MGFAGYVSICVQLYCMLVSTVFHYMFRPTWPSSGVYDSLFSYGWRILLRCFFSVLFFSRGHTLHVSICGAAMKDSENQNTIKLHADGNITCNTLLFFITRVKQDKMSVRRTPLSLKWRPKCPEFVMGEAGLMQNAALWGWKKNVMWARQSH
jgi:hypothetical protein